MCCILVAGIYNINTSLLTINVFVFVISLFTMSAFVKNTFKLFYLNYIDLYIFTFEV